ncbi:MAG: Ribosome biogenesis GTPase A [Firmicutes bacterium ADurb.Bin182]|nr:MAG: Ribosome biogenesis GTPase A [Firmicutes bacterium ADurb.Bin182]
MIIQWYPGHMAKARRLLTENLKLIDVVVEIADARAPEATRNPDFDSLFANKERIVILNKSDLASSHITKQWTEHYKNQNILSIDFVSTSTSKRAAAISLIESAAREKVKRMRAKGIAKTVRAMVVGIPNVGKSTFINCIAQSSRAKSGDKPGVTKGKQWVRVSAYLELLDTPGLLWPKLEDETHALHLAYIGSIKDDIMDIEQLAGGLLSELMRICPEETTARYKLAEVGMEPAELLAAVCGSRGFLLPGREPDLDRGARVVLDEFRAGKIARVTLEKPEHEKTELKNGKNQ